MLGLRLGLRFMRGSGSGGLTRQVLLTLGVALGVAAVLYASAVPRFLAAGADRADARLPAAALPGDDIAFRYAVSEDSADGRRWLHVVVAGVRPGVRPPPGLTDLPAQGETWASPAAAEALRERGTPADGTIGRLGLRQPDELFDVSTVSADRLPAGTGSARAFGAGTGAGGGAPATGMVVLELLLLSAVPAAVYLTTCARLSASSRARRYAALRLIGTDERTVAVAAGVESGAAGAVGAGRSLLDERHEPDPRTGSPLRVLPLAMGAGVLAPLAVGEALTGRASGASTELFLAGSALAVVGVLISVRPLTAWVARLLLRHRSLAVRIAARRLLFDPGATVRVTTGLVVLVLIAATGSAVLRDIEYAIAPERDVDTAIFLAAGVPKPGDRDAVFRAQDVPRAAVVPAAAAAGARPRQVVFATCRSLPAVTGSGTSACQPGGRYLVQDAEQPAPPAGAGTDVEIGDGLRIRADRPLLVDELGASSLYPGDVVVADDRPPPGGWPDDSQFLFRLPSGGPETDRLRRDLHAVAPAATVDIQGLNLGGAEEVRLHRGVIRLSLALGFLLGLLAFVVATADRAMERRSQTAALLVVGMPASTLRQAQTVQLLVPLVAALTVAGGTGVLIGWAYLAVSRIADSVYLGGAAAAAAMIGVSAALAVAAGLTMSSRMPGIEHLRRA